MIKLENLSKVYNKGRPNECIALDNISLTIAKGELVSIIGKSGSGKSTLLHLVGGLDTATKGDIKVNNNNLAAMNRNTIAKYRNKEVGIVLQDFMLADNISTIENVMMPLYYTKIKHKERIKRAISYINKMNLIDKIKEPVINLSGGEKQRIAIARALVNEPDLILADEPTGALDSKTGKDIIDLLIRINNMGKTVIIVTHEKEIAQRCKRIITLLDGKIIKDTKNSSIL